ncbi:MAG: gamma-glutamyl-gamma-aminobutyrate hydrolase [Candidatus Hydrogenedentota bacterium]
MKPLIGVTSEFLPGVLQGVPWNANHLLSSYCTGVIHAGGLPIILPTAEPGIVEPILDRLDGIILSGGNDDIPAHLLGEPQHPASVPLPMERWESETRWLEGAMALEKPILGICLGMQVMNVVAGGGMIQDIPDQRPGSGTHGDESRMLRHEVAIQRETRLAALAPSERITITSSHHQAIREVPSGFRLAAVSDDGIIEAMERTDREFVIGVQWHPERDPSQPNWLLLAFIRHCSLASSIPG